MVLVVMVWVMIVMHAMLMLFFFIMPGVMSGLGNLLVPIQLCVPEMVFPKVNNLGGVISSPHYTWSNSTHASLYVPTLYLSHPMSHATYPLCVSILRHAV